METKEMDIDLVSSFKWVSTWGTAIEKCDITEDAMPQMPLEGTTVRQIIRPTTTGSEMKLRLSNEYGQSDVNIISFHVAKQIKADASAIDTATDRAVTVGGSESFVITRGRVKIGRASGRERVYEAV